MSQLCKNNDEYTIREWTDVWFSEYAPYHIRESTLITYQYIRKRVLKMNLKIEDILLQDLKGLEFQRLLNDLVCVGHYSKSSVKQVKNLYSKIYKYAVLNEVCISNPIQMTEVLPYAPEKKVSALSKENQATVENIYSQLEFWRSSIIFFLLKTGIRREELVELTWNDWDKKQKIIYVRKSKTDKGIRIIPLSAKANLILHHNYFLNKNKSPYIFCNPKGKKLSNGQIRYTFKKAKELSQLSCAFTPHIMRHTFATRFLESGADIKALSDILGHTSPAFTMSRYVTPDISYLQNQIAYAFRNE
ncbi:tyrosine-type recombinase/integrase [Scatolibacter rhodanostii]|uniref:tyrosine-type recombinase/integrase n=1 Tax=Scatolibacter rhodanostii TaxID=2014781 RepID=UPI000C088C72|nr:site-specific integrase [Scatolibacter rhodanostii]